jgi:hypothetical protein
METAKISIQAKSIQSDTFQLAGTFYRTEARIVFNINLQMATSC